MLTRWSEFDRSFAMLDEFRRQVDWVFDGAGVRDAKHGARVSLWDEGANLVVRAEVPGMRDGDIKVSVLRDTLTLEAERAASLPEGYTAHRRERGALRFSRTIALPAKVDAERTAATLKNGVVTVTLPKAPEAQPRQITVLGS